MGADLLAKQRVADKEAGHAVVAELEVVTRAGRVEGLGSAASMVAWTAAVVSVVMAMVVVMMAVSRVGPDEE